MTFRTTLLAAALAALIPTAAPAHEAKLGDLVIEHPWTRATAPSAKNGGAFMIIHNHGSGPDRLVAASTAAAGRTELHRHVMTDGVMKMRSVAAIDVPAGGTAELKPGGLHVMMIGLEAPLVEGTRVPLTLTFERAGTVTVELAVDKAGAQGGMEKTGGSMQHKH